jgi:hypothetical protein
MLAFELVLPYTLCNGNIIMSHKKKLSLFESLERYFRLIIIYMGKDMTLKNRWVLFLAPTAAGILTWLLIPMAFHYAFFEVPVISPVLQKAFAPADKVSEISAYVVCAYLTYVLLKPFCRGLVVCHPDYFNEGNLR